MSIAGGPGRSYYNDSDPKAAAWLRELIDAGELPAGDVDERGIEDVEAEDLAGYTQCHFFAGIGGWPYALLLAGWDPTRPAWTGSCPCQPLSSAGKRGGHEDERHVWPEFFRLIAECRPATVLGEQVASRLGREWLSGVRADLESVGYGVGAADLPAASVGAPHIRQRLFWVADSESGGRTGVESQRASGECQRPRTRSGGAGRRMGDSGGDLGRGYCRATPGEKAESGSGGELHGDRRLQPGSSGGVSRMGNSEGDRRDGRQNDRDGGRGERSPGQAGPWDGAVWIPCADGKARRIEPGLEPLVAGFSGRVALLRGAGNSICPQVAAAFVSAYLGRISP